MPAPAVLVTRPEPQASGFSAALQARLGDVAIVSSPMMEIARSAEAFPDLPEALAGVVLTSTSALSVLTGAERARLTGRDAWCVGPRTAEAAGKAGLRVVAVTPDAEALVAALRATPPRGPLLHLCGRHVVAPLGAILAPAGIELRAAVVYEQPDQPLNDTAQRLLAGAAPVMLPLFSPRSARLLGQELATRGPAAPLFIAAISPATAAAWRAAAPALPVVCLEVAARPDGAAMLDLLGMIRDQCLRRLEGRKGAG
jgi:uroporphyrinogen-III synthase